VMGAATLLHLEDMGDGSYTCTVQTHFPAPCHVPHHPVPASYGGMMKKTGMYASNAIMMLVTLHGKHIAGSPFKPEVLDAMAPTSVPVAAMPGVPSKYGLPGSSSQPSTPQSQFASSATAAATPVLAATPAPAPALAFAPPTSSSAATLSPVLASAPMTGESMRHPMSRLERSRQRALLAKQLANPDSASSPSPYTAAPNTMATPYSMPPMHMQDLSLSPLSPSPVVPAAAPRTATVTKSLTLNELQPSNASSNAIFQHHVIPGVVKGASKLSMLAQRSAQTLQAKQQQQLHQYH
jgi:hypothetical protein